MKLSDPEVVEDNVHVTCRRCEIGHQGDGARWFVAHHLEFCSQYTAIPRGKSRADGRVELDLESASADFEGFYAPP